MRYERQWLAGSVVLAVLIVVVAGLQGARGDHTAAVPGASASREAGAAPVRPEALPGSERVGRALLAYSPCPSGCTPVVALADGREFEIFTDATESSSVTISPDGRWLGYPFGSGYVVRDLFSTISQRIGGPAVDRRLYAVAWAPDSSALLVGDHPDARRAAFTLVDLSDSAPRVPVSSLNAADNATRTPVTAPVGYVPIGVRTSTEVLVIRPDLPGPGLEVGLGAGAGVRLMDFDASPVLRPGERLLPNSVRVAGDSIEVAVLDGIDRQAALVRFGLYNGSIGRYDLPQPPDHPGTWSMLGVGPDGTVFVRRGQGRTRLWYLTPQGGWRPDREFEGEVVVVAPGAVRL